MNVLVTGGSGFVGREILRELHRAGHQIHLLVRDVRSPGALEAAVLYRAEVRSANVLDDVSMIGMGMGMDAIIHLVGIISEVGDQTFENVHTRGTQNIVAAARRVGVRRFIHMSALGTRLDAVARYHRSKWAAEDIVRNSGLDWTIFRPSIIYGPGDGFVNLFAKIIRRSPVVPIMGDGETRFQPVSVGTVARAFARSLDLPWPGQQTFDLCGPEVLTLNQIVDDILAVMKRRRWKVHVPMGLARFQAALLGFFYRNLLDKPPPLNRDQLIMLQEDNVGDPAPANKEFGLRPVVFREGIARYLA